MAAPGDRQSYRFTCEASQVLGVKTEYPYMKRSILKTTRKLALEFEVPETTRTYNEKCPACECMLSWRILSPSGMKKLMLQYAFGMTASGAVLLVLAALWLPRWYSFLFLLFGAMNTVAGVAQFVGGDKPTWGFDIWASSHRGWPGNVQLLNEPLNGHELIYWGRAGEPTGL